MVMFPKKKKKVIAKPVPVQAEEVETQEQQEEEGGSEEPEGTEEELPDMPSSEPKPLSREEVLDLVETNMTRSMELLRYARTLK